MNTGIVKIRFFFLSLVSLLVISGILWVGISLYQKYKNVTLNFIEIYQQAQSSIQEKRWEEAYSKLLSLSRVAQTEEDWKRILKQAYKLSSSSGQYVVLLSLSEKATKNHPKSELFWAFQVYAGLRVGIYDKVYEWANNYLKSSSYDSLRREALIGYLWGSEGEDAFFSRLQTEQDPALFEKIGDILENSSFFYNASLLYLKEGDLDSVHRIFKKISHKKIYTRSFAFLGYKVKNWDWVLENLSYLEEEDSDILLLMGDVYLIKRDYQNAAYIYEKIISEYSDFHVAPYINLALIQLNKGEGFEALETLEKGKYLFGESSDFVFYYAMVLGQLGRILEALDIMEPWLDKDSKINLLAFNLANRDKGQSVRVSSLWKIWFKNQINQIYDKELIKFMLFEFAKSNLWYDFDLLVSKLPLKEDYEVARFLAYRDFHFGNLEGALSNFFKGITEEIQYQAYYNAGLIYYHQNDFKNALDSFNHSLDVLPFKGITTACLRSSEKAFLGKLYFFKGYSEYYQGRQKESKISFEQAIDLENESAAITVAYYNLFSQ